MYGAKEHLLFDAVRHTHGAGDDAHRQNGLLLHGMDKQVGVDIFPAVYPEMMAELVSGTGGIVMGAEFGINSIFYRQFLVGLTCYREEFARA